MAGMRPTVHAKINGIDAVFLADSGSFWSILTATGAHRLNIPLLNTPHQLVSMGGMEVTHLAHAAFTLFGTEYPKVEFLVAGSDLGGETVGLLGQNVFRIGDTEYDLANGMIRVLRTSGDCQRTNLAYWANAKHQVASEIEIEYATATEPHNKGTVYVNGKLMHVIFDTGASITLLDLNAARRAGVPPPDPGGERRPPMSWIASVDSFKIGDEEVKHTRLRVGPMGAISHTDMLIGADFFLAHHVLIASSQRKLYFTYNGGPVFNLTQPPATAASAAEPANGTAPVASGGESLDAGSYARRGAAETSRHNYAHAIADLTRACELAPNEPDYFYERGMAYSLNDQGDLALADFGHAIQIKPDDLAARLARARLHVGHKDADALVLADLDVADRVAASDDSTRLEIGALYERAGNPTAAITEYTQWIDSHNRDESDLARGLNGRCWARALSGRELAQALDDCDRAVRRRPEDGSYYDSRGLVQLRLGHYDQAIRDYDKALRLSPKNAWSLYGRGIAKLRKGDSAGGHADIAAATAAAPKLPEEAARYGIKP